MLPLPALSLRLRVSRVVKRSEQQVSVKHVRARVHVMSAVWYALARRLKIDALYSFNSKLDVRFGMFLLLFVDTCDPLITCKAFK